MNVILSLLLVVMPAATPFSVSLCQTKESVSVKDLRKAATTMELDNRTFTFKAYPWRDFAMGSRGPDGSPLMVVVTVASADEKPLPNGLRMDRVWVLFGEEVWEVSDFRKNKLKQDDIPDPWINCPANWPRCEFTVRGGPKWGPQALVDVVVRLTDRDGRHYFLQAANLNIIGTH